MTYKEREKEIIRLIIEWERNSDGIDDLAEKIMGVFS